MPHPAARSRLSRDGETPAPTRADTDTAAPAPIRAGSGAVPRVTRKLRVLLVDDHEPVRRGARRLIDDQPDMTVIGVARSYDDALLRLDAAYDVAVVDYRLGDGRDGLLLTRRLKCLEPAPRVLIYSAFADAALTVTAIVAGADGLLSKRARGDELCDAIRRLARGRGHLPAPVGTVVDAIGARLQSTDRAIVTMLVHGAPPALVAERLGLTPEELRARRVGILRKLRPARTGSILPQGAHAPLRYASR